LLRELRELFIVGCREFPLDSDRDLIALSAILRLATKYHSKHIYENAIRVLQRHFPSTLSDWRRVIDNARFHWNCDAVAVINLAQEVRAFSVMPAAMASLTNGTSAAEVFGIPVHTGTMMRNTPHILNNPRDIEGFALMKDHNHVFIVRLIGFVRDVGRDCIQPPEPVSGPGGMSPVGTRPHEFRTSVCSRIFHDLADSFAVKLTNEEDQMGFHDFSNLVWQDWTLISQRLSICRGCRSRLKNGYEDIRKNWWDGIPLILGLTSIENNFGF
jgi:hypothetical protein